jgi:hypothetical protein
VSSTTTRFDRARFKSSFIHGLGVRAIAELLPDQTLKICQLTFGDGSDRRAQVEDRRVRQAIRDKQTVFPTLDQGSLSKHLKML